MRETVTRAMTNSRHGRRSTLTTSLLASAAVFGLIGAPANATPDPLAPTQWALASMRVPQALARLTQPLSDATVAVVDTGVDLTNPDLAPRLWQSPAGTLRPDGQGELSAGSAGWDFVGQDATPSPERFSGNDAGSYFDHGTKIAGILGAASGNGIGVSGVAPNARIMAIRTCTSGPAGCIGSLTANGMAWAATAGARVVNVSVGGSTPDPLEAAAVQAHPETLFIVSAGNEGRDIDRAGAAHWPCSQPEPNVICVASTDQDDRLSESSNYGVTSVDIAAPGVDIATTVVGGTGAGTGTSEATPQVAGVATLLLGAMPDATATEVRDAILTSARPVSSLAGKVASGGVVDAEGALLRLAAIRRLPAPVCPAGAACEIRASVSGRPDERTAPTITSTKRFVRGGHRWLAITLRAGSAPTTWRVAAGAAGTPLRIGRIAAGRGVVTTSVPLPARSAHTQFTVTATSTAGTARRFG